MIIQIKQLKANYIQRHSILAIDKWSLELIKMYKTTVLNAEIRCIHFFLLKVFCTIVYPMIHCDFCILVTTGNANHRTTHEY